MFLDLETLATDLACMGPVVKMGLFVFTQYFRRTVVFHADIALVVSLLGVHRHVFLEIEAADKLPMTQATWVRLSL
jgi:hypothetical protein